MLKRAEKGLLDPFLKLFSLDLIIKLAGLNKALRKVIIASKRWNDIMNTPIITSNLPIQYQKNDMIIYKVREDNKRIYTIKNNQIPVFGSLSYFIIQKIGIGKITNYVRNKDYDPITIF